MLATWGTSTGFNPATLFAGGEQGAWYDPSDNLTMYGTAGGASPITGVEQAVGLILDKSKGLAISSDTLSGVWLNAFTTTFDTFTSTSSDGFTATTTGAKTPRTRCAGSVSPGLWYQVTFTVETLTNASLAIWLTTDLYSGSSVVSSGTISTVGTYTRILGSASSATVAGLMAIVTATGASTVTISGITVKPLAGNHAYQATDASRPTLRARYNLLTFSEQFDNAAWTAFTTTVSANATTAPDGTLTAEQLTAAGNFPRMIQNPTLANSTNYVGSVYLKQGTAYVAGLQFINKDNVTVSALFNLSLGTLVSGAGTITSVGDGWYRCSVSFNSGSGATTPELRFVQNGQGQTGGWTGTNTIFAWGAQLIPTAVFPSNTYQRIAAATDYATGAAFPQYLAFDGTDDSLLTANVDFATVTSDGAARRNLLLNPTQFDAAGWTQQQTTVTANSTVAPDGTSTADKVIPDVVLTAHAVRQDVTTTVQSYAFSVYAKAAEYIWITVYNTTGGWGKTFNLQTGTVGTATIGPASTATIENVGNGWYRCILVGTATAASNAFRVYVNNGDTIAPTFSGDGTSGIFLWGAQVETGSTATAFQNIGTDKMTVFSGLSKLSDAASGMLLELSVTLASNNGTFALQAPGTVAADFRWNSKGTVNSNAIYTNALVAAPVTVVNTSIGNIEEDISRMRINGLQVANSATDQGTGNYGTYPLFIGRRNNATLPFNGRIYSLIVRGAASNTTQVAQTERYVASKTPLGVVP